MTALRTSWTASADLATGPLAVEVGKHPLGQQQIDVVTAQMRVAVGRQHLEHAVLDTQDRDVERAAAKIVDRDGAVVPLVEAVRQRCRCRLIDDAEDLRAGDAPRVPRRGALGVVEVRGHGDHRPIDVGLDLALGREERLRPMLQLSQNERRDLGRRELATAKTDPNDSTARFVAPDAEGKVPRLSAYVLNPLAHETFDRVHGSTRVGQQTPLGFAADVHRVVRRHRHHGRHERVAILVPNDDRHPVFDVGDEAIRGAEVYSDDFAHQRSDVLRSAFTAFYVLRRATVSSLSMPASRLLM